MAVRLAIGPRVQRYVMSIHLYPYFVGVSTEDEH